MSVFRFYRDVAIVSEHVARRAFRLRQTTVVLDINHLEIDRLRRMLDESVDDASITFTDDDAMCVEQAYAVIAGKASDGTDVYLLVEASINIVEDDVDLAKERASLLQRATGATTHALVIGRAITDEAAARAKARTVTFVAFPSE